MNTKTPKFFRGHHRKHGNFFRVFDGLGYLRREMYKRSLRISVFNLNLRPFSVRVRGRDQRRLFAPNQGHFRTVEKIKKFQPEVELLPVLYKIYSKIFCIFVFNLNLRPFAVGVRLRDQRRLFATHQGLFRTVEKFEKLQPEV